MVKTTLNTLKDLIDVLRQKSLRDVFLGKEVYLSRRELIFLDGIKKNLDRFAKLGGRKGDFIKKDIIHKGRGTVYLSPAEKGKKSILLFDNAVKIQSGPDLYVYLSTRNTAKAGVLNLGLLKGAKGGQSYLINKTIRELQKYKYVLIYCKKFDVLFTYAPLR